MIQSRRRQVACLLTLMAGALVPASAQQPGQPAFDPKNLSGYWELRYDSKMVPPANLTRAVTKERLAEQAKKDMHAVQWCSFIGTPAMMDSRRPLTIRQDRREVFIYAEERSAHRHLYLNRSAPPPFEEYDPSTNGHSIARWEGDILVVVTTGFHPDRGITAIPGGGFKTAASKLTERFRLLSGGNVLSVRSTWEDSGVFRTPHTYEFRYYRAPSDYRGHPQPLCSPIDQERINFVTNGKPEPYIGVTVTPGGKK